MTTYGERLSYLYGQIDDEDCPTNLARKLGAEAREIIRRDNLSAQDPWGLNLDDEILEVNRR